MRYLDQMSFTPAAITRQEYLFLAEFTRCNGVQTVLEFGPGVSTYAFLESHCAIYSFEHNPVWLARYSEQFEGWARVHVHQYDAKQEMLALPPIENVPIDMAFIDAPAGGPPPSRRNTCMAASRHTDIFLLHDARRVGEQATLAIFRKKGWQCEVLPFGRGIAICQRRSCVIPHHQSH
jgi:predicted O-methyltransferase YrrM